jgi:hypothetical protein
MACETRPSAIDAVINVGNISAATAVGGTIGTGIEMNSDRIRSIGTSRRGGDNELVRTSRSRYRKKVLAIGGLRGHRNSIE